MSLSLRFLGAAREVTGSMHLVETSQGSLLIDCGFFQGRRQESRARNRELPKEALAADAVLLTHAHIDHSGSLPTLVKRGYKGSIWTTPATRDLAVPMLRDSARIQQGDARWLNRKFGQEPGYTPVVPIYDEEDAIFALSRFIGVPYGTAFSPLPGVTARFLDAGHILGSAQIVLDVEHGAETRRLVFSGDLGRTGVPILRDPERPERPDYVVMESTYGDRVHASVAQMHDDLERIIHATLAKKGRIIVPSFALGRTQELIYVLHQLHLQGRIPALPIYVDSPLATRVTEVFKLHPECFDAEMRAFAERDGDPFTFGALRYVESQEESMALNDLTEPAIILSASGMCESGRVLHHLRNAISDDRNTIVIVGFMAQHTLGRRLMERRPKVRILGVERDLLARVEVLSAFSAHADKDGLRAYALATKETARHIFLVHGEPEAQEPLRDELVRSGLAVSNPARGDVVVLD